MGMRSITKKSNLLVMILLVGLLAGAQKPVSKNPALANSQRLNNATDSLQYVLGAFLAKWITANGFQITNAPLFIRAMDDVFLNKSLLIPDTLLSPLVDAYQHAGLKTRAAQMEQQLFTGLRDKAGIGMFPNGVRYSIVKTGKGPRPTEKDSILVNLIAKLPDETVVEDTYQSKKPFAATINSFFPGLNATLAEMPEGSKWVLYIPSGLAYGEKGTSLIPPYSALVLEVELLEVRAIKK